MIFSPSSSSVPPTLTKISPEDLDASPVSIRIVPESPEREDPVNIKRLPSEVTTFALPETDVVNEDEDSNVRFEIVRIRVFSD